MFSCTLRADAFWLLLFLHRPTCPSPFHRNAELIWPAKTWLHQWATGFNLLSSCETQSMSGSIWISKCSFENGQNTLALQRLRSWKSPCFKKPNVAQSSKTIWQFDSTIITWISCIPVPASQFPPCSEKCGSDYCSGTVNELQGGTIMWNRSTVSLTQ